MQIWYLQSKCVTIIQNYNLRYSSWGSTFLSIGFCNVLQYVIKRYVHIESGALITWIGKISLNIFLKADILAADALGKSFMPNGFSVAVTRSF